MQNKKCFLILNEIILALKDVSASLVNPAVIFFFFSPLLWLACSVTMRVPLKQLACLIQPQSKEEARKIAYDVLLRISSSLGGSSAGNPDGPYNKLISMVGAFSTQTIVDNPFNHCLTCKETTSNSKQYYAYVVIYCIF